jgi:hypothetical protein
MIRFSHSKMIDSQAKAIPKVATQPGIAADRFAREIVGFEYALLLRARGS